MTKVMALSLAVVLAAGCDSEPSRHGTDLGTLDLGHLDGGTGADQGPATDGKIAPDLSGADGHAGKLPFLAGVNLAGADFAPGNLPGTFDTDYTYPTQAEVDYFVTKGMNVFRLPFLWERLQQSKQAAFDAAELARIDAFVSYATGKAAYVVLDPHNYARYYGDVIGQGGVSKADFADFWTKLANHYKSNPLVIFGLMNEPHDMSTELWRDDANAAIQAIRAAGATNLILVPGNGWTGAHSWDESYYGTPNSTVMLSIVDPGNNYAFEVHQYLDSDSSGTSASCVSAQIGADRLKKFTAWLKTHGHKGFLGEFGGGSDSTCLQALDTMLSDVDANKQHWIGWAYWAAGPWWYDYFLSIEPKGGQDAPQMSILSKHL